MTRPLVNVRLADDVTEALDRVAARRGLTRSDVIRQAIDAYLVAAGERVLCAACALYGKPVATCADCGSAYFEQTIDKPSYSH